MADQRPIGYWLRLVDGLIDDQFAGTLDEHGVTRMQWQLLNVLARGQASVESDFEGVRRMNFELTLAEQDGAKDTAGSATRW